MSGSKLYIGNLGPDVSQELIMRELRLVINKSYRTNTVSQKQKLKFEVFRICVWSRWPTNFKINNTKSREKQIEVSNIVLNKRGFAFVDLQDNVALDKAIEKLSGMKINGKEISVEHSGIFRFFFDFSFLKHTFFSKKK